jgi:hypothetical protein
MGILVEGSQPDDPDLFAIIDRWADTITSTDTLAGEAKAAWLAYKARHGL